MGLAPHKPRLAGVKLVFLGFFVLTNPSVWIVKEGHYQDRPPLCPFRLLPLLIYSGSAIAFFNLQGPKIQKYRKCNPPSTLNGNQIPQIQQ